MRQFVMKPADLSAYSSNHSFSGQNNRKEICLRAIFSLLGLILISIQINAQAISQKPDLKFQRIHEGLNGSWVTAIHQDSRGFIWAGTTRGLHRFDGIQFKIYTSGPDSTSINNNHIYSIYEDSKKRFWVGTGGGVARYNTETDDFTRYKLPLEAEENFWINTILEDENGRIWLAGGGSGLYYFDEKNKQFIPFKDFSEYSINSMTGGKDHVLWFATTEIGVIKLNTQTGETQFFSHEPSDPYSISSNSVNEVQLDNDGNLWAGTNGWGLNRLEINNSDSIFHRYVHDPNDPFSLNNNEVITIYVDNKDDVWIGNRNGGLHLYNKTTGSFFHYDSNSQDPFSLSHNSIEAVFQDNLQRYWIGTAWTGINMADTQGTNFLHYFSDPFNPNSLNNNLVRDFYENDDGSIWIATDGGGINLYERDKGTFRFFKYDSGQPGSLRSDAVISLNKDNQGNLWAGTWGGGPNILTDKENGIFTRFTINEYPLRHIFDIHFDGDYVWLAAFEEGLFKVDLSSGNFQRFNHDPSNPSSISTNFIIRIFEDSQENLWIGTQSGLNKITAENKDNGTFQRYLHSHEYPNSIAHSTIRQIFEDQQQNIWIATEGGLSKYIPEKDQFLNYYQSDGLPSDEVNSIIEDDNGILWIGTLRGISRFEPDKNTFTNYNQSHGLQGEEFSRYSVLKTQNGELLFGGINGFNLFKPEDLYSNPHSPPVFLTDLRLFNKSVDLKDPDSPLKTHISVTDRLVLPYHQNVITFEFIALNYTQPEFNQYAYMVEGFENQWNYVGTQRNATYTNLSPGNYTFRVKAANNDGVWNEEGVSLALIIKPPFWQTTWFYLLTILIIGFCITTIFSLRVRRIREHNRELEMQVADRTDELRIKNQDLIQALNELEAIKDELVEKAHLAGMAEIASGVLHNVGNILNSVNTSSALIRNSIHQSKIEGIFKANELLRQHIDQIEQFINENPKGKELMNYYLMLEDPLKKEREEILSQTDRLEDKINLIKEVISAQQTYAGASMKTSQTSLDEMIEKSLSLQAGSIERHGLIVKKNLKATSPIMAHRSKLIHVLVNIFKNAKEAMAELPPEEKKLFIKTWQDHESVYLSIADNGPGLKQESLKKIFSQGFTTKKNGHGFGLHSSANYIAEMGGSIQASNSDNGKGAVFIIKFPLKVKAGQI
ncbi:MAG: GHKL domain-containing protein [Balneolaceae bacterium]|nr:MAG: GHKL domain-containing protein [Balneolaceae bacterium]